MVNVYSNLSPIVQVLDSINIDSCPNNINLHCHTTYSDGSLHPEELIKSACNLKLKHLAITDHHSISAFPIIQKWIKSNSHIKSIPKIWTGIEISCILSGCLVHIIGLDFDYNSLYIKPYIYGESVQGHLLNAESVINSIRSANGISILAHPARYRLDYAYLISKAYSLGISGIEVWYDYNHSEKWTYSEKICKSIESLTIKYQLLKSCGTDTHGYSLLGR